MAVYHLTSEDAEFNRALDLIGRMTIMGIDTETSGLDPFTKRVLLIQIGNEYDQFVFDVAKLGKAIYKLKPYLENPHSIKLLHNADFDYRFLKINFGFELCNIFDTMLAELLLKKGVRNISYGLADVTNKYVNTVLDKTLQKSFIDLVYGESFSREQIEYAAKDVEFLERIFTAQQALLHRDSLDKVTKLEMATIPVTAEMELNGMLLDKEQWKKAETEAIQSREKAIQALNEIVSPFVVPNLFGQPDINYNSPAQLLKLLQTMLPKRQIKTTSEKDLKDINEPVITALLKYRGFEKQISTYGSTFLDYINPMTGKIHSEFKQLHTDTGRFSSDNPNLQNIPAKDTDAYRKAFIAHSENDLLVDADYSNMELRILADLSKEPAWLDIFERGLDMHSAIGSMIFKKPIRQKGTLGPEDPGENLHLRRIAKSLNFGISYGMGPKKLAHEVGIPFSDAKQIIKSFWSSFPLIKNFFAEFVGNALEKEVVRSPYDGRLRWLDGYDYDNPSDIASMRNLCMNFPMQSGNASITKLALVNLHSAIKQTELPFKILLTIHDEIILNSPKDMAKEAEALLTKHMLEAAQAYVKNVTIKVESTIATYWKH